MQVKWRTVVLPANIFTDQVEDEFCPITRPQVGTSLSGSTMSSTIQARSEKSTSQKSTYSEKTVQNQLKMNPQQEEEKSSEDGERFQSSQEEQREGNRTPEELFLEHFTAEPVRDEVLEETMSDQIVITTPASHPQEEWRHLEIVEDSLMSAATSSEETRSTNSSDRRSGRIRKKTQ